MVKGSKKRRGSSKRRKAEVPGTVQGIERTFTVPQDLPVVPAKDIVAFPSVVMSLYVGRPASVHAIERATSTNNLVFVVAQRNQEAESPGPQDLYSFGVVATVLRSLRLADGRVKVFLQGLARAEVKEYRELEQLLEARIHPVAPPKRRKSSAELEVLVNRIRENLQVLVEYEQVPEELLLVSADVSDPGALADVIVAHYHLEPARAQAVLEELDPIERLRIADAVVSDELNQFLVSEKIRDKTRDELEKGQRDFFLREQMKLIQKELGEGEGPVDDLLQLKETLTKAKLPDQARTEAMKQLKRLQHMSPESGDYSLLRTYLEWVVDLPWGQRSKDRLDLKRAQRVLDADHYGLDKVKERIIEYLSVRKLNSSSRGPILCFVGPPGVGKTSLGKSIAEALSRKFVRMSLGGMRDEAEIRGHRRTYVGAMPGRILQSLKQAGTCNPVFVLDELDKIGADFRGDPASALLEVLDPQQNSEFRDHYLGVPFDLSEVLFIATANTIDTIPDALLDRLEVIYLAGYTTDEKINIAQRFLIPRQLQENGLKEHDLQFDREAIRFLIERYTREAGVRGLERELGALMRKLARLVAENGKIPTKIRSADIRQKLGNTKFDPEDNDTRELAGLARGLAWTVHGGEIMPIEASVAKGNGQVHLTGQLGEVMQESAHAALFYARANAELLGLDPNFHSKLDIHIHVPSGATPKDGPSAGITIATALISALSHRKVSNEVAMTGEITLRGNVLPVGGLKEKALAALRYGIRKVIIPFENIKDLEDIPKEQRQQIRFIPTKHISEVLEIALLDKRPRAESIKNARMKRKKTVATA
ncbi:MAG: endopeptidase La [Bdellovibrionota bacterium]|nr:MAG: endopeptidase La [Bdellovibrionota bacterium]